MLLPSYWILTFPAVDCVMLWILVANLACFRDTVPPTLFAGSAREVKPLAPLVNVDAEMHTPFWKVLLVTVLPLVLSVKV